MSLSKARKLIADGLYNEALSYIDEIIKTENYPLILQSEYKNLKEEVSRKLNTTKQFEKKDSKVFNFNKEGLIKLSSFRCAVIAWDNNHNCVMRAYKVAKCAEIVFKEVIIIGFSFNIESSEVWEPLKDSDIPIYSLPNPKNAKGVYEISDYISKEIDLDLVIACKPRLPSLILGILIKLRNNIPLIVDIDDYELGFPKNIDKIPEITLEYISEKIETHFKEKPNNYFWTKYSEKLVSFSDGIITSNKGLQKMYGGFIIPHVQENEYLEKIELSKNNPIFLDHGIPSGKYVVFLGTPRKHKGVVRLAEACSKSKIENLRLIFIGKFTNKNLKKEVIHKGQDRVYFIDNIEFNKVSNYLSCASLVTLIQDKNSLASKYQLPAKAVDAIGAGVKLLTTDTEPLRWLKDFGFAGFEFIKENVPLEEQIDHFLSTSISKEQIKKNNDLFLKNMTYKSGSKKIKSFLNDFYQNKVNISTHSNIMGRIDAIKELNEINIKLDGKNKILIDSEVNLKNIVNDNKKQLEEINLKLKHSNKEIKNYVNSSNLNISKLHETQDELEKYYLLCQSYKDISRENNIQLSRAKELYSRVLSLNIYKTKSFKMISNNEDNLSYLYNLENLLNTYSNSLRRSLKIILKIISGKKK